MTSDVLRECGSALAAFTRRQWLAAGAGALATGLLTGLPTDVVPNPFYQRMTSVLWWQYPVWASTAVLAGLVLATYVRRVPGGSAAGVGVGGGVMSFLAVGCPICNKLVVALIGVGGALSFFAPLQPFLAAAGLMLLAGSLGLRLHRLGRCSAVSPAEPRVPVHEARG